MMNAADRKRYVPATLLVLYLLMLPFGTLLGQLFPGAAQRTMEYYLITALQELLLWLLPALFFLPWRHRRIGPKNNIGWLTAAAVFIGAASQLFSGALPRLPGAGNGLSVPMPSDPLEWAAALAALCILPAICEEVFFRGCVTSHLMDSYSPLACAALSTLMFALMHRSLADLPAHLMVSLCCTLLMMSTGRVISPVLLHLGYNLTALLLPYIPPSPWWLCAGLLPGALIISVMMTMRLKKEHEQTPGRAERLVNFLLLLCLSVPYFTQLAALVA